MALAPPRRSAPTGLAARDPSVQSHLGDLFDTAARGARPRSAAHLLTGEVLLRRGRAPLVSSTASTAMRSGSCARARTVSVGGRGTMPASGPRSPHGAGVAIEVSGHEG